MRPYGRCKTVKGAPYKKDCHNKKLGNWWEDICCPLCRTTMKQINRNYIKKILYESEH